MAQIAELEVAFTADTKRLNDGIANVRKGVSQTGAQITKSFGTTANDSITGTTSAVINFNRVIQDAPYGIIGVANNLDPLAQSFLQLKHQTGSSTKALKTLLVSAFTGPGALITAVSLASSLLLVFGDRIFGAGNKAAEATNKFDGMKSAIDSLLGAIAEFDEGPMLDVQIQQSERVLKNYKGILAELENQAKAAEEADITDLVVNAPLLERLFKNSARALGFNVGQSQTFKDLQTAILEIQEKITAEEERLASLRLTASTNTASRLQQEKNRLEVIRDTSTEILKGEQAVLEMNNTSMMLGPSIHFISKGFEQMKVEGSLAEIALRGVKMEVMLAEKVGKLFVNTMTAGLSAMITQAGSLEDKLKNVGKMLLQAALQLGIQGFISGGLTTGKGFFGGGGGLFGSIGKLFSRGSAGAAPVMDRGMLLQGEFKLDGQDLKLVIDRANQVAAI